MSNVKFPHLAEKGVYSFQARIILLMPQERNVEKSCDLDP